MTTTRLVSWTVIAALTANSAAWAQRAGTLRNTDNTPQNSDNNTNNRSNSLFSQSESNSRRAGASIRGSEFRRLSQLMKADVVLKNGDAAGSIQDFVIGPQGDIAYLIANNGDQFYSIPYGAMEFNAQNQLQLGLTPDQFQDLPFFANNNWPNFGTQQFRGQMVNAFGPSAFRNATGVNDPNDISNGRPYGNDALPSGNLNRGGVGEGRNNTNRGNNTNQGVGGNSNTTGRRPGSITNTSPSAEQRNQQNNAGNNNATNANNNNNTNRSTGGGVQTGPNNATGPGLTPGTSGQDARRPIAPNPSGIGNNPGRGTGTGGTGTNAGNNPGTPSGGAGTGTGPSTGGTGTGANGTGANGTGGTGTAPGGTGTGAGAGAGGTGAGGTGAGSGAGGSPR